MADISVARSGQLDMAVTACFAGPIFNMLVSLGVAGFTGAWEKPNHVLIGDLAGGISSGLTISFWGLVGILVVTAGSAMAGGFKIYKVRPQ